MPYFVDPVEMKVLVRSSRVEPSPTWVPIPPEVVARYGDNLVNDAPVSAAELESLRRGDLAPFDIADAGTAAPRLAAPPEPILPPVGHWQYRVIPITEMLGFATAKGTAERIEGALNELAVDGWELVTTSERDSRWIGNETVTLIVRRFVVSEREFEARFEAEERARRRVLSRLDAHLPPPTM
jgi:hypothetical protein